MALRTKANLNQKRSGENTLGELATALDANYLSTSFPENIGQIDHWMALRINKSELLKKDDFPILDDIHRIFLPMPIQLQTEYAQTYAQTSLGPLGKAAAGVGAGLRTAIDAGNIENIKSKFTIEGLKKAGEGAADTAGAFAAQTLSAFSLKGAEVGKGALAGAGIAVNPYLAMLYESPNLRMHSLSWKLVAKNFKESLAIYQIVKLLKYHSAPEIKDKTGLRGLLQYPEQFDVDFHYENYLYNIGPCVVINVMVNYHPDGILYHVQGKDKLPVGVQLSLQLQETSIVTKKEINDLNR